MNEVLNDSIEMAAVDCIEPDGSITPLNWRLMTDALADVFLEVMEENPGPVPVYQMCA